MTWAWYTASVETPAQKLTSANYEVTVVSVTGADGAEITPIENGSYSLAQGNTYTVILTASGTVKECGGYCLIQNENGEKTYTQTFKPGYGITVQFTPASEGNYTFSGVWGSLPTGTANYLHHIDTVTEPIPDNTDTPAQSDPTGQPSEPTEGTYTVQSGDTLSSIAETTSQQQPDTTAETAPAVTEPPVTSAPEPETESASDISNTTEVVNNDSTDISDPVSAESP